MFLSWWIVRSVLMKTGVTFTAKGSQLLLVTPLSMHSTRARKSLKSTHAARNQGLGGSTHACRSTMMINTTKQYPHLFHVRSQPVSPSPTVATCKISTGALWPKTTSSQLPKTPLDCPTRAGPMPRSHPPRACVGIASSGRTPTARVTWPTHSHSGRSWGRTAPQSRGPKQARRSGCRWTT